LQVVGADNRLRTLNYAALDIVDDPVRNLLYASVSSTSATSPNSIVAIDPLQGTVVTTQALASQPGRLAVSDDGSYLYAAVGTTGQVSRLLLPSLTPDIQITTWSGGVEDIEVAPGLPHTVAVTGIPQGGYCGSVGIYDDAVKRPLNPSTCYPSPSFDTVAWGQDATTLYATMAVTSGGPEYIFSVNSNGPTLTNTLPSVFGSFDRRIFYYKTSGLIYDGYGVAANAATGASVGQFNVENTIGYGQNPFAIDPVHSKAFFLDSNYVSSGSVSLGPDIQAFDLNSFSFINSV
jgi:hypothetical protein